MLNIALELRSSLMKKSFILFSIIFALTSMYVIFGRVTLNFYPEFPFGPLTYSKQITHEQCRLSLKESDNWFCEFDYDWKRRKHLHHIQDKRNNNTDSRAFFFQNNWEPSIQCEFERRVGNMGDGGKWVCDIHQLKTNNLTSLIYSFGSNGDFSFERAIKKELPKAEIHTFDVTFYMCPLSVCIFHQARLGDEKINGTKSLHRIISELGHTHRQIDVLKVDIEGSEFDLFEEFFNGPNRTNYSISTNQNRRNMPYIRQILFEIHLEPGQGDESCRRTHRLFELFRSNNYAIFHKEANLNDAQNVFEYALIRLNAAFFNTLS